MWVSFRELCSNTHFFSIYIKKPTNPTKYSLSWWFVQKFEKAFCCLTERAFPAVQFHCHSSKELTEAREASLAACKLCARAKLGAGRGWYSFVCVWSFHSQSLRHHIPGKMIVKSRDKLKCFPVVLVASHTFNSAWQCLPLGCLNRIFLSGGEWGLIINIQQLSWILLCEPVY